MTLIESIVNVNCGRNPHVLKKLYDQLSSILGLQLLHIDEGWAADRTVLTLVGDWTAISKAIGVIYDWAETNLTFESYQGNHPSTGVVDVVPFVPLYGVTKKELARQVNALAEQVSHRYKLPILLYGALAPSENQYSLSQIRNGGVERVKQRLKKNELKAVVPEYTSNDTLGASNWTVRDIMVAYNVNLSTSDLSKAKAIARRLREFRTTDLRWAGVKFLAWYVPEFGCCQISTNIYDITAVSMCDVFELVSFWAHQTDQNLKVTGSELIGMTPLAGINTHCTRENYNSYCKKLKLDSTAPFDPSVRILELALNSEIKY